MSGSQMILLGGNPQQAAVDPYFYSVTSLLHGDGTNGGQNNTFLDSSTNNFTITRNGNTTQGSFSPFSQTGWAFYQNPLNDYLNFTTGAGTLFQFTGDYTIEVWVFLPSIGSDTSIWVSNDGSSNYHALNIDATNYNIYLNSGSPTSSFSHGIALNAWTHVAMVRSGSTVTLYTNGLSRGTITNSSTNGYASPTLARNGGGASGSTARYLSNLRIVKGTAVYTAAFTPPTTPLTAISGTSLLTSQANRFLDASSNALVPTVTGSPSVQPFSPFNPTTPYSTSAVGGSGYFDGSGDFLTAPNNSATDLGSGDFTVEAWIYTNSTNAYQGIIQKYFGPGAYNGWSFRFDNTGKIQFYCADGSASEFTVTGTSTCNNNAWHHVAAVRSGSTVAIYVDGVRENTGTCSFTISSTSSVYIGQHFNGAFVYTGYIAALRVVKGSAVYSGTTYTVPTSPPTAIANTSLLLNFTNGAIFDNAAVADYETVGNAQISTSVKKYGTGSMYFDGTGDYLLTDPPSAQLMAFGTGDFTVEMWVYFTAIGTNVYHFYDSRPASTDGAYPTLRTNASAQIEYVANSAVRITGLTLTTNTWYHVALCRTASQTKLFVNGTQTGSTYADTTNYLNAAARPLIGGSGFHVTTLSLNGYVDDVRISKGVARYPYNFTPPTAEFPNIGGTVTLTADPYFDYTTLLLPGNGTNGAQNNTFLDSSTNAFSITRNGNTTQGTFSPFSQTGWGNFFDGTGDYLTAPSGASPSGTGTFTVEFWIYPLPIASGYRVIFANGTGGGFAVLIQSAGTISYGRALVAVDGTTTGAVSFNQWNHVALVRSGTGSNQFVVYINGTSAGTFTNSTNYSAGTAYIGIDGNGIDFPVNAYLSNVRVTNTAVYTSNFTPSTTPLTAISGTSLLTCQSNRFIDNSTNNFTITRNGDVSVQAFSPFNPTAAWSAATNGGSGYFDGSGDYLNGPATGQFAPTGNFTISMWIYPTSFAASFYVLAGSWNTGTSNEWLIQYDNTGAIRFLTTTDSTFSAAGVIKLNQWQFISISRTGSTLTGYVNGTSFRSYTLTGTVGVATKIVYIGAQQGTTWPYIGYMADFRLVDGSAESATPPTAPATAISGTNMLLNFTNAGIYDATSKNDLETVGNAQISTTQSKFGGSSMYFDGTGDWLAIPATQNIVFGTADFTIEMWVYSGAQSGTGVRMMGNGAGGSWASGKYILTTTTAANPNKFTFGVNNTTPVDLLVSTTTFNDSTWRHVAITRYGNVFRLFVNGIQESTNTSSASVDNGTAVQIRIGSGGISGDADWAGYIDDLRITKGIARYTSNFTPPSTAFLTL